MTVRERTQQIERQTLAPYASLSQQTRGRQRPEEECALRTCYQRDRDRIIHCKAFRRLKQKTQVFLAPEGDHYPHPPDPYVGSYPDRPHSGQGAAGQ